VEFGVPLVKCDTCLVSGDLPSHGPYPQPKPHHGDPTPSVVSIATLNDWLAHGANVNEELNHAILGDDIKRVPTSLRKSTPTSMLATCRARRPCITPYICQQLAS
jgi:hypothetical protein